MDPKDNVFKDQIRKWQSNLKSCIVQSFSKIRSRKRKFSESEIGELLEKRKKIKLDIITNPSIQKEEELNQIESQIANATEVEYMNKVFETLGHITGDDGGVSASGLWKAKQKLIPNDKGHNPVAVNDKQGNLITNPEGIKRAYLQEMLERLRHRIINPNLIQLQLHRWARLRS